MSGVCAALRRLHVALGEPVPVVAASRGCVLVISGDTDHRALRRVGEELYTAPHLRTALVMLDPRDARGVVMVPADRPPGTHIPFDVLASFSIAAARLLRFTAANTLVTAVIDPGTGAACCTERVSTDSLLHTVARHVRADTPWPRVGTPTASVMVDAPAPARITRGAERSAEPRDIAEQALASLAREPLDTVVVPHVSVAVEGVLGAVTASSARTRRTKRTDALVGAKFVDLNLDYPARDTRHVNDWRVDNDDVSGPVNLAPGALADRIFAFLKPSDDDAEFVAPPRVITVGRGVVIDLFPSGNGDTFLPDVCDAFDNAIKKDVSLAYWGTTAFLAVRYEGHLHLKVYLPVPETSTDAKIDTAEVRRDLVSAKATIENLPWNDTNKMIKVNRVSCRDSRSIVTQDSGDAFSSFICNNIQQMTAYGQRHCVFDVKDMGRPPASLMLNRVAIARARQRPPS